MVTSGGSLVRAQEEEQNIILTTHCKGGFFIMYYYIRGVKHPDGYIGRVLGSNPRGGGVLFCGKSTFNKYALVLGYQKPKKKVKVKKEGLRASYPFQWLHVDVTFVPTLYEGMQKIAFIKDNFSRAILHYASTDEKADSQWITELFEETFQKYDLYQLEKPMHILSDGGSENKGKLLEWVGHIHAPPVVKKITARTEAFPQSNSMSESTHRIYKSEFMQGKLSSTQEEHLKNVEKFVENYNHHRFPTDLFGLSPMEVLEGKLPDRQLFSEAKTERIQVNQAINECKMGSEC